MKSKGVLVISPCGPHPPFALSLSDCQRVGPARNRGGGRAIDPHRHRRSRALHPLIINDEYDDDQFDLSGATRDAGGGTVLDRGRNTLRSIAKPIIERSVEVPPRPTKQINYDDSGCLFADTR